MAVLIAGYTYIVHQVVPGYIKDMLPQIEAMAPEYINGAVTVGGIEWDGGLSAQITDITVKDTKGEKIAVVPRTVVQLNPLKAMEKPAKAVTKIDLMRPEVFLTMDAREEWNMQHLLKESDSSETPFYGVIYVTDGVLHLTMPEGQWDFGVNASVDGGANPDFAIDGEVRSGTDKLKVSGLMQTTGAGKLTLAGDALNLAPFASLAKKYAQVEELQGGLGKMALVYESKNGKQSYSGDVDIAGLRGKYAVAGHAYDILLDGKVSAHDNYIMVKTLDATVDEQKLHVEGQVDLRDTERPSASGKLTSPSLTYDGYNVTNLSMGFVGNKDTVVLHDVDADYGGGHLSGNGTYEIENKKFVGDLKVEGVTHPVPIRGVNEDVSANGNVAVIAHLEGDDNERIKLQVAADTLLIVWRDMIVDRLTMDGIYDEKGLAIDHFSLHSGANGNLAMRGTIGNAGELALTGRMTDLAVDPLLNYALDEEAHALASADFKIGGTTSAPEFGSNVQFRKILIKGIEVPEAHGFIGLHDNIATIKDFTAYMPQGKHHVAGTIDLKGEEPYFDMAIDTDHVRLEPIVSLITGIKPVPVTGNVSNILQVRGTPSHPYVYGEVHASDGSAVSQLYNSVDGRYAYEDGTLHLTNFIVNAFYGRVTLDGVMTKDQRLDFEMEAQDVDLNHLPIKDETVNLDGLLNAKGHLGGTLEVPFFNGDVNSDALYINGEKLTEVSGTLKSNGKETNTFSLDFKQPYKNDETEYGLYSADMNINLRDRYMQGKVSMMYGDIGGMLRMARQDYDINGQMMGEIDFDPAGPRTGTIFNIYADNVKVQNRNYDHMNFKGRLNRGVIYFDDVMLQEKKGVKDAGLITISGDIDLRQKIYNVFATATKANPAIALVVMKNPPEVTGETDMTVRLTGPFDNPEGMATVNIANGSVAGVLMDSCLATMTLKNDHLNLEELYAAKDAYNVKASGDIPLDLFRVKEERRNPNAQMDINVDLDNARLGILPALTKWVEWATGETEGKIRVAGTLEEPLLYGNVKITDGNVKVKYVNTVIENITMDSLFEGEKMRLNDLSAKLGKGTVQIDGSYALRGDENVAYRLHAHAKDAEIASSVFSGRINSDLEIVPQEYRDFRKMKGNEPPPKEIRPQIKGDVRLDDVLINIATVPEMGEGESNYGLDLALELGPKIHLNNPYLYDIWINGGLKMKGSTRFPIIEGNIKADRGTIKYLRTDFKLDNAMLTWVDVGSFLPNVTLDSTARFSRYRVFMRINGPVSDNMDLQLTSDPPLERNTIVRMLTLQRDTAGSADVTGEDMNNLMVAGLQMTVLGDVELFVKQNLGLDQFRIYTGKVRSGIGFESVKDRNTELTEDEKNQYNVLISKYMTNHFMLGYTTSFNGVDQSYFGQYDIGRHLNLTYSHNITGLQQEKEDWYGLEYKISF